MRRPKQNILTHIVWWLMYHGDENPIRLWRDIKKNGYHKDCRSWAHPDSEYWRGKR